MYEGTDCWLFHVDCLILGVINILNLFLGGIV
jgi:hypothetical protein